jgi:membrane fusion protein (multidrug efflux system)
MRGRGVRIGWVALGLAVLAAAGYGIYLYRESHFRVSTDDAAVEGALVTVTARVAGPVVRVPVRDNQEVQDGQILVEIDPGDHEIRVIQARAAVARARAEMEGARAEVPLARNTSRDRSAQMRASAQATRVAVDSGRAQLDETRARLEGRRAAMAAARADAAVAEAALEKTRLDLDRTSRLITGDLIARQDHDTAVIANRSAAAALEASRRRLAQAEREVEQAVAEVRTRTLAVEQAERRADEADALVRQAESQEAEVPVKEAGAGRAAAALAQAEADLAGAERELAKTRVQAPGAGTVSKKTVEPGHFVQPGQPLMALVPLDSIWVVANFKETQLAGIRPGLRATVRVDTFTDRVFTGRVESISAGTGSRFSLLPPENASGNWVKVVQRVPVKIVLDGYRANPHVLRPGMSATVTVELR